MRVVVDANVVAAALVRPAGWTAENLRRPEFEFVAPDFIRTELLNHEVDYAKKAGVSLVEWRGRVGELLGKVRMIPNLELRKYSAHRLVIEIIAIDADDAAYVATFLAAEADFLWTRDRALKAVFAERAGPVLP